MLRLELCLSLFNAKTEEELENIAKEVLEMSQAIEAYYRITAESEFRERERLYEKARHDEASALHYAAINAEHKNSLKIAGNLLG